LFPTDFYEGAFEEGTVENQLFWAVFDIFGVPKIG
jgi:hypothetical protein